MTFEIVPQDRCELGLPFDNLFFAIRNLSNDSKLLERFDGMVDRFQFKEGHSIPWREFKEFVDLLFLVLQDKEGEMGNFRKGYDLENDREGAVYIREIDSRRKGMATPYSQLLRKNRGASTSVYDHLLGEPSTGISTGSISDRMRTFKVSDNIMAKALASSVHKFRDVAHLNAGDGILSTLSQLTFNNRKLSKKKAVPQEHHNVESCQRLVNTSCSGGKKKREYEITYRGPHKVVKELNKVDDQSFSGTLRNYPTDLVGRLDKDDYVTKYNERGDSRMYRVKYDADDERKETPIEYDELLHKRKLFNSDAFTVSMAPPVSDNVLTISKNERFKNDLDKSKIVELLDPRENYVSKWFAMKEKRDMRR